MEKEKTLVVFQEDEEDGAKKRNTYISPYPANNHDLSPQYDLFGGNAGLLFFNSWRHL